MTSPDSQTALDKTIIKALCYADIFDFPLTLEEIVRFAPEGRITAAGARDRLKNSKPLAQVVGRNGRYYFLNGHADNCRFREEREADSRRVLETSLKRLIPLQGVPFLRMATITGALAAFNSPEGDDIDLLVISAPGRTWTTYFAMRLWRRLGNNPDICFNMFLTEGDLYLENKNLFYAREILGSLPIYDTGAFDRLLKINKWIFDFYPSYEPDPERQRYHIPRSPRWIRRQRLAERMFDGLLGDIVEYTLRKMQSRKLISGSTGAAQRIQRQRIKLHKHDNLPPILGKYGEKVQLWLARYHEASGLRQKA